MKWSHSTGLAVLAAHTVLSTPPVSGGSDPSWIADMAIRNRIQAGERDRPSSIGRQGPRKESAFEAAGDKSDACPLPNPCVASARHLVIVKPHGLGLATGYFDMCEDNKNTDGRVSG